MSPAGEEQLPPVETPHPPWWDMVLMRSKEKLQIKTSLGLVKGLRHLVTQK